MEKKQWKKIGLIGIVVLVIVAFVITALLVLSGKKEDYRIIKVYEVSGEAIVTREGIGEMEAYQNMLLESGDSVVLQSGEMTLRLDDDKYVYVEADTEFKLIATGTSANSRTSIELEHGAITNEIQNPLSENSSYEVNTPNSNMSVRGTIFRVHTYYEDGVRYSKVSVFEGKVESRLRYADGSLSDAPVLISDGDEVLIYDDEDSTDYVGAPSEIKFEELPKGVLALLSQILGDDFNFDLSDDADDADDAGDSAENKDDADGASDETGDTAGDSDGDIPDTKNDAANQTSDTAADHGTSAGNPGTTPANPQSGETAGTHTVTFMYNGTVFGTQTVKNGGLASKPRLMPASSGSWDFDFSTPIGSDTTIEWR